MSPPSNYDAVPCDKGARRRQKSREAARCRRQVESDIFSDICSSIPIPQKTLSQLDRSTIMRLLISFMKLRGAMDTVNFDAQGVKSEIHDAVSNDEDYINALNGFILILSHDCDVMYASNNINEHIGIKSLDMIGQNLFEYTHEGDHPELTKSLKCVSTEDAKHKSIFLRIKSTLMSSGRSVTIKSATYKVVKCEGIMHYCTDPSGTFTVLYCEPIPHPSNIETVLDSKTYLSQHSLDMKFTYCDSERVKELTGYAEEDMLEHSFFDFCHSADIRVLGDSIEKLLKLGQILTVPYRMLARSGGYVWVVTEATVITNERNHQPSYIVCVNHAISGVMQSELILSSSQMNYVPLLQQDEIELLSEQATLPEIHLKDSTDDIFHNITDLLFDDFGTDTSLNTLADDIFDSDVMPSGELPGNLAQNAPSIGDDFDFSQINFAELFGSDVGEGNDIGHNSANNFQESQSTTIGNKLSSKMRENSAGHDHCLVTDEKSNELVMAGQTREQTVQLSSYSVKGNNFNTSTQPLSYTTNYQIVTVPRFRYDQVQENSFLKRKLPPDCASAFPYDCGKQAKLGGNWKKSINTSCLSSAHINTSVPEKQLNRNDLTLDSFVDVDWAALAV